MDDERRIEEAMARYLRAADHRDATTMAGVFVDDGLVEIFSYSEGELEPLGQVQGADSIGRAVAGLMSPHPPRGWSHHTTLNPIITVTGETGTFDAQFIVYNVVAHQRPAAGWPAGASGAQGTVTPIETGYMHTTLRQVDGHW